MQMGSPFSMTVWQANDSAQVKVIPVTQQPPEDRGPEFLAMIIAVTLLSIMTAPSLNAQVEAIHKMIEPKPNVAAASLSSYLERVRAENSNIQAVPGSIWTDSGRLTRMSTDVRAMRPHDLISVVVSESLAASTDGTVKNSRASNASSAISGLIGTLHAGNALQNLVNQTSSSGLNAQGTSATNSSLGKWLRCSQMECS